LKTIYLRRSWNKNSNYEYRLRSYYSSRRRSRAARNSRKPRCALCATSRRPTLRFPSHEILGRIPYVRPYVRFSMPRITSATWSCFSRVVAPRARPSAVFLGREGSSQHVLHMDGRSPSLLDHRQSVDRVSPFVLFLVVITVHSSPASIPFASSSLSKQILNHFRRFRSLSFFSGAAFSMHYMWTSF